MNEHHAGQLVSYMKFAKYQRGQCVKSIKAAVQDTKVNLSNLIISGKLSNFLSKETRLMDDTFTLEEVEEIIEAVTEAVTNEIESELINSAHTNVLLLQQLFGQGEKWHLNLETDLSELENRSNCSYIIRALQINALQGPFRGCKKMGGK